MFDHFFYGITRCLDIRHFKSADTILLRQTACCLSLSAVSRDSAGLTNPYVRLEQIPSHVLQPEQSEGSHSTTPRAVLSKAKHSFPRPKLAPARYTDNCKCSPFDKISSRDGIVYCTQYFFQRKPGFFFHFNFA